ncbi:MAG: hypothetical protein ACKOBC_12885 [Hyphomicrobiales bacterium]
MNSLLGMTIPQPYIYVLALAGILVLLAVFAYVLGKIVRSGGGYDGSGRGRLPRLGIVDTFSVDRQRQLMIVRRDNVEHLVLIGGNSDLVIETNITRANAAPQRDATNAVRLAPTIGAAPVVNADMASVTNPFPKAPPPPFSVAKQQIARQKSDNADIKPANFAEIAGHFERSAVTNPMPKAPSPTFSVATEQIARQKSENADIKPADFAEIARHFERSAEPRASDATLPDVSIFPSQNIGNPASPYENEPTLTASHEAFTASADEQDPHQSQNEEDPLSAPIIPLRNKMSPTEGLRRLLGRNGEPS